MWITFFIGKMIHEKRFVQLNICLLFSLLLVLFMIFFSIRLIGLYTPINYFGRYATCSHKDGGRSHIQSRETIGQEDHGTCLKLGPHVNSSNTRRVFSINTSSSNTLVLFYQISSQQQHTPFSMNQQERKSPLWMGLADIHIQWQWDDFQSLRNCPFLTIKKGHFNM